MKKTTILTLVLIIILSIFNISYGATNRNLKARFTEKEVPGTNFKEITITPYYNSDEENSYYIYLPSGYFVQGSSASYVADKNGEYPFTVYHGKNKETFTYKVKGIDKDNEDEEKEKKENIYSSYQLKYDYEKKQVLFYMELDKQREVTTPSGKTTSNEVVYYINNLKNNTPYDFSITVDEQTYDYKVIKSGEYYLLIFISPVNYNDYSTVVEYFGYNFTNSENYTTYPSKGIYDDNGNYVVLVKSENTQQVFSFHIDGIDYRRPSVSYYYSSNDTITLEMEDDFGLDYIITFDGKYVDIDGKTATYEHLTEIEYKGDYIFTIVDKKGNRTVKTIEVNSGRAVPRQRHAINLEVHDFKNTEKLFSNKGMKYDKDKEDLKYFENILPAYMSGKSPERFNPDSPISRAEIVTIFCRLNDLPYDTSAYLKSKFTDIDKHWARDYIAMGSSKKYVSGYKDKTFRPNNNITRAEFCQMLTKISTYKSLLNDLPATNNYEYLDINGHWAEKEIIKIASRNLITSNDNHFYPDKPITRGEVVHAINALYGFNPSSLELDYMKSLFSKYYNFKDINKHKYYNDIIISVVGMYREKVN